MGSTVKLWALACLVVVIAAVLAANRIGRQRAGSWLVVFGVFLLSSEEPMLTMWWSFQLPSQDPDGLATLVTAQARAHIIDISVFGIALAVLLGWIALKPFPRGEPWARRVLSWGLWIALATELGSMLFIFSRGLPLPGPGGEAGIDGFGWQPLAVGLLAWAAGLRVSRNV